MLATATADIYTATEDTPLIAGLSSQGVLANDSDPDFNESLAVQTPGTFSGSNGGTLVLAANGTFTYTPAANFNGTETFTNVYNVMDSAGGDLGERSNRYLHRQCRQRRRRCCPACPPPRRRRRIRPWSSRRATP